MDVLASGAIHVNLHVDLEDFDALKGDGGNACNHGGRWHGAGWASSAPRYRRAFAA